MVFKECIVKHCRNNSTNAPQKIFLCVPPNLARRRKWFEVLKFEDKTRERSSNLYCCEDHFDLPLDAENWMFFRVAGKALKLKKEAVPHKYLEGDTSPLAGSQLSDSTKKRKISFLEQMGDSSASKVKRTLFSEPGPSTSTGGETSEPAPSTSTGGETQAIPPLEVSVPDTPTKVVASEVISSPSGKFSVSMEMEIGTSKTSGVTSRGTQVPKNFQKRSVRTSTVKVKTISRATSPISLLPPHVATATEEDTSEQEQPSMSQSFEWSVGGSSYFPSTSEADSENQQFPISIITNRLNSTIELIRSKPRFYLGVPDDLFNFINLLSKHSKISERDVMLTLKKIRQGDAYERLADDFNISSSNVQRIFRQSVGKIADTVQQLIFWPDSVSIKRTLPIPFRARYKNVESIIDCFEIEIEKATDPIIQSITWSEYKKCNTLKFLISSTPSGFINFISGAFGGRISDKEIFTESGYLDVLPNGAEVMADRGFKHVAAILNAHGNELIRPPSVSEGEQLSKEEMKRNKTIASLRVHIERVIRRIREFEMLGPHSCIHHNFSDMMNHIVIIACGIINIQGPLIQ